VCLGEKIEELTIFVIVCYRKKNIRLRRKRKSPAGTGLVGKGKHEQYQECGDDYDI
jgi:hypothetical protein